MKIASVDLGSFTDRGPELWCNRVTKKAVLKRI